jgi:Kef-type K+ transport system membrane component KefB
MNPTAIESHLRMVLAQWIVIIAMAWLFGRVARRLRQPLAVGEIAAGLLLGPSALGALWPSAFSALFTPQTQQSLQLLGKIGLILLLFQVGMEFDFGHLRHRTPTVIAVSLAGILAPMACGLAMGPWLHREFAPQVPFLGFQLFLCVALSISALPIMGRILLELKLERTALGAIGIGAAAIDDVVGWILLAVITALAQSGFHWQSVVIQTVGVTGLFLLLVQVVGPWLGRQWQKARVAGDPNSLPVPFLALLLIVLFGCALTTNLLGVFSIFGAFLLGVSLHRETGLVRAWREKFADLVLVAFVPVFFTNTGLRTEIGSLSSGAGWLGCLLVLAAAVAGKLGGCYAGARFTGQPGRDSACIAALMNARGLMGLVAINVGADLGLLPREVFTMFVIMALATTAMTAPLLRLWLPDGLRALLPDLRTRPRPVEGCGAEPCRAGSAEACPPSPCLARSLEPAAR